MRFIRQAVLPMVAIFCLVWLIAKKPGESSSSGNQVALAATNRWGATYGPEAATSTNKSPVAFFRKLMAMTPEEREKSMAEETEARREWLKGKVAEYGAMSATERELRFQTTELRWYLLPLMRMSPNERVEWHDTVPREYHNLVEARLQQWDKLLPDLQKDVLENQLTMAYFVRLEGSTRAQQQGMYHNLAPDRRKKLEADVMAFRAMPPEHRQKMLEEFNRFFDLNEKEKTRIVAEVPRGERQEMEKTLYDFEKLSPEQRQSCIESVAKYANMTPEQKLVFIENATIWKKLTSDERRLWREFSQQLPPSPPGLGDPPLPPDLAFPEFPDGKSEPQITRNR